MMLRRKRSQKPMDRVVQVQMTISSTVAAVYINSEASFSVFLCYQNTFRTNPNTVYVKTQRRNSTIPFLTPTERERSILSEH